VDCHYALCRLLPWAFDERLCCEFSEDAESGQYDQSGALIVYRRTSYINPRCVWIDYKSHAPLYKEMHAFAQSHPGKSVDRLIEMWLETRSHGTE